MCAALTIILLAACTVLFAQLRRLRESTLAEISRNRDQIKKLEEEQRAALEQARANQFAIFDSMVEGILILDEGGRIRSVNKSLEKLFNLGGDVLGKTVMEAFRQHELLEIAGRARKEGAVRDCELQLPGIHRTRYFEVNAASIQTPGADAGLIIIFHDFTRIRELESIRKEFVANVSHELRTPLTLIKGYVETLIDGAKDDPEIASRFLQTIHKHADRLAFLIEDLLTISLFESGEVIVHLQATDLRAIVERVLDEFKFAASQRSMALSNTVPAELIARADAGRLEQVIYNLVDNAIKYGRQEGSIVVSAEDTGKIVKFSVHDDGPGIPPEAKERIFERFFRVDRARSRQQGGTGLGLSIVKHIVQAHGGSVWVDSTLEKGSTFHFTLPKEPALGNE